MIQANWMQKQTKLKFAIKHTTQAHNEEKTEKKKCERIAIQNRRIKESDFNKKIERAIEIEWGLMVQTKLH